MRRLPLFAALVALALSGCRGTLSDDAPIHPNLNMDFQEKFEAQEANPFFADDAAMRQPVPGTVARGLLRTTGNAPYFLGRSADGAFVQQIPMAVNEQVVERGQERYNIYCAVCHGRAGDGQGIIMTGLVDGQGFGYTPAPTYHTDRLRSIEDGYYYDVITHGIRSMPSYAHELSVPDRWAIVSYIRALQLSQYATEADVPDAQRAALQTANPNVSVN
jgi:mono/diheme cytochrome c family protein